MEHILLAYVRWQDTPSSNSAMNIGHGSAASLGVPTRLKDWIRGYPAMLLTPRTKKDRLQPRRGARTVRVISVRRNVRMYSPDLVKSAASWATRNLLVQTPPNGLSSSKEWDRVAPSTLKLSPRYADSYKKRMDLPSTFNPYIGPGSPSPSSTVASSSVPSSTTGEKHYFGHGDSPLTGTEDRFRSLTDMRWGEFETMGFRESDVHEKMLQFDLTESARTVRLFQLTFLINLFCFLSFAFFLSFFFASCAHAK